MIANALLLIGLGLLCLIGAIVALVFTIISFANNKSAKFSWLTAFLICLVGLIICIVTFARKAVHKVEDFTNNLNEHMSESLQNFSDSVSVYNTSELQSNKHIQQLKRYYDDSASVPDQFYYYLGFENYYRFPLRYPYSIHCTNFKDNGELYNESNVSRFDENDNGEILTSITKIDKLAFDKKYLLIDQKIASSRSADYIHHYILFSFDTEKTEEAKSEKELLKLALQKGYTGSRTLKTIEEYGQLFYSDSND